MRRILCYGDSNTWGFTPGTGKRYSPEVRWTGVAQKELGTEYVIIEEGLNSRTTVYDHPRSPGRKGSDYLLPCMISHMPLDLVVLMLGTNDLQWTDAYGAAEGVRVLIKNLRLMSHMEESEWIFAGGEGQARILLVAPPKVHPDIENRDEIKRRRHYAGEADLFSALYERVARETGVDFLDAAAYTRPSAVDGLHLESESHLALGKAIAAKIREMFGE